MSTQQVDATALLVHAAVAGLRVMTLFLFLPLFAKGLLPQLSRGCLGLAIALPPTLAGVLSPVPLPEGGLGLVLLLSSEITAGALLGLGIGAFCAGLQAAGEIIDHQTGLTFTQNIDPMHGNSTSLSAHLLERVLFAALMASGLLLVVVDTVYLSYQIWPVGQPPQGLGMHLPLSLASQASRLFAWALLLAGPVVLVLFVLDLGLGLLNRSAPQFNVFGLSMSLKPLVGLAVLAAALPMLLEYTVLALFETVATLRGLILGIGGRT